ncbi:MAG TPA: lysozyme inhibitor LprI family protein [Ensifer sp.]|nr:lysozyme inhibitor LprI family protein [Ensifer sp.]
MRRMLPVLAPLFVLWATSALADDEMKCNPEGTQQEMNICAWDDFQKADDELNAVYKKAVAYAKSQDENYADQPDLKGAVAALKKAQRAWIDYRDGHCEGVGFSARGGSMEPMLVAGCQEELTKKRIADLKALMEDGEAK